MYGELIIGEGPITSGKTTWLTSELARYADLGCNVAYICHSFDNRSEDGNCQNIRADNNVTSHNSQFYKLSNYVKSYKLPNLSLFTPNVEDFDVIGIDEGQFFPDLYDNIKSWIESGNHHVTVLVAGLPFDHLRRDFPNSELRKLESIADKVIPFYAKCKRCLEEGIQWKLADAPFSAKIIIDEKDIDIGGGEKYMALCRKHYVLHYEQFQKRRKTN